MLILAYNWEIFILANGPVRKEFWIILLGLQVPFSVGNTIEFVFPFVVIPFEMANAKQIVRICLCEGGRGELTIVVVSKLSPFSFTIVSTMGKKFP